MARSGRSSPQAQWTFRRMSSNLSALNRPVVAIGSHCTKPNRCAFMAHCHRDVEPSAPRPRHIDRNALKHYLGALQYPLYFMDFETLASPDPLFDGTRPYSQVPFQFSLHRQDAPGGAVTHTAFLAEGGDDPRVPFVTALLTAIGPAGDILTYYRPRHAVRSHRSVLSSASHDNPAVWTTGAIFPPKVFLPLPNSLPTCRGGYDEDVKIMI